MMSHPDHPRFAHSFGRQTAELLLAVAADPGRPRNVTSEPAWAWRVTLEKSRCAAPWVGLPQKGRIIPRSKPPFAKPNSSW